MFSQAGPRLLANVDIPCTSQGVSASKLGKEAGNGGFLLTPSEGLSQPPIACHSARSV